MSDVLTFKVTRRHRIFNRGDDMVRAVKAALENSVKRDLIDELDTVVANWSYESRPEWESKISYRGRKLALEIFSSGENEMIFQYVDKGTEPHPISAVNAPLLIFQMGYSAKTAYRGLGNMGSGTASGNLVMTPSVNHPGNEARDFTGKIVEQYKDEFLESMTAAVRSGLRL